MVTRHIDVEDAVLLPSGGDRYLYRAGFLVLATSIGDERHAPTVFDRCGERSDENAADNHLTGYRWILSRR